MSRSVARHTCVCCASMQRRFGDSCDDFNIQLSQLAPHPASNHAAVKNGISDALECMLFACHAANVHQRLASSACEPKHSCNGSVICMQMLSQRRLNLLTGSRMEDPEHSGHCPANPRSKFGWVETWCKRMSLKMQEGAICGLLLKHVHSANLWCIRQD